MDMDKILDGVLEEIKLSKTKQPIRKGKKAVLSKKNKTAIKKASEETQEKELKKQSVNEKSKKEDIKNDIEEDIDVDDCDMEILTKKLKKLNNKHYKNMYYISHKMMHKFVEHMNSNGVNIDDKKFEQFMLADFHEIMMKFISNLSKKNRKKLHDDVLCMGRTINEKRCSRRKLDGQDYCQSHLKRLTNGRIDEPIKESKKKNKRGRKRKVEFDPRIFDNDTVTVWADIVDGERVLVDRNNNVYTFDVKNPIYLGKKSIEATLLKVPYTEVKN